VESGAAGERSMHERIQPDLDVSRFVFPKELAMADIKDKMKDKIDSAAEKAKEVGQKIKDKGS
jgi:hypothetical protein